MQFAVLGTVRYKDQRHWREIVGEKPRTLLGLLLLHSGAVVSTDRVIEALWGEQELPSAAARHNIVARLRRTLGSEVGSRIETSAHGYAIRVAGADLDVHVFTEYCAGGHEAARTGRWAQAHEQFEAGLALWRGEPLADVPALRQDASVAQLLEAKVQALEGRIAADLHLGGQREVIGELRALVRQYPLRESLYGQLILALYRDGLQAEAMGVFTDLRRKLAEELGTDPSTPLQELNLRVLRADPGLLESSSMLPASRAAAPSTAVAIHPSGAGRVRRRFDGEPPTQLPVDARIFVGRTAELARIDSLAQAVLEGAETSAVVVSAIDGMGGVGKSALAVRAAHRLSRGFPDGQLFLDLNGNTSGVEPLAPADALEHLLRSLAVPPQRIPRDLAGRAALYRTKLTGSRTLILLDNAATAAQVRPLLPGDPGCLVLVTSRRHLAGLEDAHWVTLDTLAEPDAIDLLRKVAGPDRIPPGHPAAAELAASCGYLPLALRIAAARLRHHRALRVEDLVAQLREEPSRLGHLRDEDRDLARVFASSYADLPEAEQRLFRLLGLVRGPDIDAFAAAHLLGTDHRTAERLLESLLEHSLLIQPSLERYRLHDLLRAYAQARSADEPASDRDAAGRRLLLYYQDTASWTKAMLYPAHGPVSTPAGDLPVPAPRLSDRADAQAWLRAEWVNILGAGSHNDIEPASLVALSAALALFLAHEGRWREALSLHLRAAAVAHQTEDRLGEAGALLDVAEIKMLTGEWAESVGLASRSRAVFREVGNLRDESKAVLMLARAHVSGGALVEARGLYEQGLAMSREAGDEHGEADALRNLGRILLISDGANAVGGLLAQSVEMFRRLGAPVGEANALSDLGRQCLMGGDYPAAAAHYEKALAIYRDQRSGHGEALMLWELGRVRLVIGEYAEAARLQQRALTMNRDLDNHYGQALALWDLGRVRFATGAYDEAAAFQEQALALFSKIGDHHGEGNALHDLGRARHAQGDLDAAADLLDRALVIFRDVADVQGESEALSSIAALTLNVSGPGAAADVYRRAHELAQATDSPLDEARALEGLARSLDRLGDRNAALTAMREAADIYQRLGAAEADSAAAALSAMASTA